MEPVGPVSGGKIAPGGAVIPIPLIPLTGQSCFIVECLGPDTVVHLGPVAMATKDLEKEMALGTPFGLKLREIAKKVEALV